MSKWSAFSYSTKVKCKPHFYRVFWSRHINKFKKGLDKFTDDRPIRGIKHNLMQPLALKASEPHRWQKRGWHMRGRIIRLPCLYMLFPVHSPGALLKIDKPLVWSRVAILTFWYGRNTNAAHVLFITQIVWSCFICQYERTLYLEL